MVAVKKKAELLAIFDSGIALNTARTHVPGTYIRTKRDNKTAIVQERRNGNV